MNFLSKSKPILFSLFIYLFWAECQGQEERIVLNFVRKDTITTLCPNDTTVVLKTVKGMSAYQTENDKWDGVKDTLQCISLFKEDNNGSFNWNLDTMEFNTNKPLFIKYDKLSITPDTLIQNEIYFVNWDIYKNAIDTSKSCPAGFCTGLFIEVEIPDSLKNSKKIRLHEIPYKKVEFDNAIYCLITENFEKNNLLKNVIIQLKFNKTGDKNFPIPNNIYLNTARDFKTKQISNN